MYLKYFQKSKRALRLNREASTSSVNEDRREGDTHGRLSYFHITSMALGQF